MILAGLWKILLTNQSSDIQIINTPAGRLTLWHKVQKQRNFSWLRPCHHQIFSRGFPYLQVGLVASAGRGGGSSPWPGTILPLYLYYQSYSPTRYVESVDLIACTDRSARPSIHPSIHIWFPKQVVWPVAALLLPCFCLIAPPMQCNVTVSY